ncbi:MAG: sporulation protein YabP [Ruminococcaceae bacterium]|nr:sporulation protein YabP [Oscillospiraceae bacterium]
MEEKRTVRTVKTDTIHNLIMENRGKLSVSGVEDVESFHEEEIVLHTTMGVLILRGRGMHINKLSVEVGEVIVEGEICAMEYTEARQKGGSFLARMFR